VVDIKMNNQQIKAICDVLGETDKGYTKKELMVLLEQSNIEILSDGNESNLYGYKIGLNKREWLCKCMINESNKMHSCGNIYIFLEKALNPVAFTDENSRDKYNYMLEGINKVLIMTGIEMTKEGKLTKVEQAKTLDEVDKRVNDLKRKLYSRAIHNEVKKYCIKEYLEKDYFDAVFEAAKGLAERVRQISGLNMDGGQLFQTAFSKNDPYVFFNTMKTESELSEFSGLKELMEAVFHLVRNPAAHTPKVNWKVDEEKALDVLTIISFAHKYLDECYKMPGK
jgi:uncharacterized protein (TIGR02391 family)